jgi:hypothetical protein
MPSIGGKREGAGRKRGGITKKTTEIAQRYIESGNLTPLEVMLTAMQKCIEKDDWMSAHTCAKDAAPFVHPRLATVEHGGQGGGPIRYEVSWIE